MIENHKPRLAVFTLCRDRIEYTRTCLTRLWQTNRALIYPHLVIDNGSEDGTRAWLYEQRMLNPHLAILTNDENVGIGPASQQAVRFFQAWPNQPDILIKIDNDCYVHTEEILEKVQTIFWVLANTPTAPRLILGPHVTGINRQPAREGQYRILNYTLAYSSIVGGIFQCIPFRFWEQIQYPEHMRKAYGQDHLICDQWYRAGGRMAYIEELLVEHYETTDGQAQRYPWYFERRRRENQEEQP